MFWIVGGDAVAGNLGMMSRTPWIQGTAAQFCEHVDWIGFRFYDMIFPLFLFIIGATLPFSIGRRLEDGSQKGELTRKILGRTALLYLFGLLYNGMLDLKGWEHLRIFGVLQRQALGYGVTALLFLYTSTRTRVFLIPVILLGYWALLTQIHVAGMKGGPYTEWGNLPNAVDRLILHPGQMWEKYGDPEGPVSMLPAFCTGLLGLFAGQWLKSARTDRVKLSGLLLAGVVSICLGLAWAPFFPVIKKIWTSSYTLIAAGGSCLLLAAFYYLFDVKKWRSIAFPLVVIGTNSITIYMAARILPFEQVAKFFVGGLGTLYPHSKDLIIALAVVAIEWLMLYQLYRRKIFLKI